MLIGDEKAEAVRREAEMPRPSATRGHVSYLMQGILGAVADGKDHNGTSASVTDVQKVAGRMQVNAGWILINLGILKTKDHSLNATQERSIAYLIGHPDLDILHVGQHAKLDVDVKDGDDGLELVDDIGSESLLINDHVSGTAARAEFGLGVVVQGLLAIDLGRHATQVGHFGPFRPADPIALTILLGHDLIVQDLVRSQVDNVDKVLEEEGAMEVGSILSAWHHFAAILDLFHMDWQLLGLDGPTLGLVNFQHDKAASGVVSDEEQASLAIQGNVGGVSAPRGHHLLSDPSLLVLIKLPPGHGSRTLELLMIRQLVHTVQALGVRIKGGKGQVGVDRLLGHFSHLLVHIVKGGGANEVGIASGDDVRHVETLRRRRCNESLTHQQLGFEAPPTPTLLLTCLMRNQSW